MLLSIAASRAAPAYATAAVTAAAAFVAPMRQLSSQPADSASIAAECAAAPQPANLCKPTMEQARALSRVASKMYAHAQVHGDPDEVKAAAADEARKLDRIFQKAKIHVDADTYECLLEWKHHSY